MAPACPGLAGRSGATQHEGKQEKGTLAALCALESNKPLQNIGRRPRVKGQCRWHATAGAPSNARFCAIYACMQASVSGSGAT